MSGNETRIALQLRRRALLWPPSGKEAETSRLRLREKVEAIRRASFSWRRHIFSNKYCMPQESMPTGGVLAKVCWLSNKARDFDKSFTNFSEAYDWLKKRNTTFWYPTTLECPDHSGRELEFLFEGDHSTERYCSVISFTLRNEVGFP